MYYRKDVNIKITRKNEIRADIAKRIIREHCCFFCKLNQNCFFVDDKKKVEILHVSIFYFIVI